MSKVFIERKHISQQVLEQLKEMIQKEPYRRGVKLPSEQELSDLFQVSRSPIREALSVLTAAGVIESKQGGGRWVKDVKLVDMLSNLKMGLISMEEVHSLLEMRHIIETEAAALAATRANERDLIRLETALLQFKETVQDETVIGSEADTHFHYEIVRASKNPFLVSSLENIGELLNQAIEYSLRFNIGKTEKRRDVYKEHENVFLAIQKKDASGAREAMNIHITNVRKKLGDKSLD
ncbi:FadR/GntR family transcriptional regulator [Geomicrobium sediminis]|uniref:GntR family transcriptional repressor for pyruvate dehydrogenase complex n=1 Tax=Geomicrobium sediminis TaxID=1347788 RepID=A0ABS2PGX0_9BACL|nr:FadR/GntR family transcriptional regulator [Geomicrobium sediminis]MBM7634586.1 GntR family transcriptional repressor for pyruvate dehydrogenase complex [Geomicrobium sediminis]